MKRKSSINRQNKKPPIKKIIDSILPFFIVIFCIFGIGVLAKLNIDRKIATLEGVNQSIGTLQEQTCTRTERYQNPPEFDRALSLINQRQMEYNQKHNITNVTLITPCIVVKYADLKGSDESGVEGYFKFGDKNENANYLPIYVDYSYKDTDDLITALLLKHEITHAAQYLNALNGKDNLSCMDKEVQAFLAQANFIAQLNSEEKESLDLRLSNINDQNPELQLVRQFSQIEQSAINTCGNDFNCIDRSYENSVKSMVYNNPFYQQECGK